jgi:hypothetical protein
VAYPDEREYRLEYPAQDEEPFRLAEMTGHRRRPRWIVPALCLLVVAVLAGAGGAWAYSVRSSTVTPPLVAGSTEPSASPTPSPSVSEEPAQLDEELTCLALVPLMNELIEHIDALVEQKKQPDKAAVAKLEADLRDLHSRAPADMRPDIVELIQAASTLSAGGVYGSQVSGPGVRLLQRCRKYARP